MKLSISNIAWNPEHEADVFKILQRYPVQGIEIAPSKIWPNWQGITPQSLQDYREQLGNFGFQIPALQAILFGQPDAVLFGTEAQRQQLLSHLRFVTDIAEALGAKVMVLGAPNNRNRGDLPDDEINEIAVSTFKEIGDYCASKNTCLCIEPNPTAYNCNYIINSDEGLTLVKQVNSRGFGLHLDAAGMFLADEKPEDGFADKVKTLRHFHISEPNLGDFAAPQVSHAVLAQLLKAQQYDNWVSIEMRAQSQTVKMLEEAVIFSVQSYL